MQKPFKAGTARPVAKHLSARPGVPNPTFYLPGLA